MQQLRRLLIAVVLASWVAAPLPAAAAARGRIVGVVENATTGRPQPGVPVALSIGEAGTGRIERRVVRTDEGGRYAFEDLGTGERYFYALDARFEGGLFAGSPLTIPSDTARTPVIDTTLRVWNTTTDPAAVLVRHHRVFVLQDEQGLGVLEAVTVVNPSDLAYIGRGSSMGEAEGPTPSLGFWLPDGADRGSVQILDSDIDIPERLVDTGFGFGITSAIPPGTTKVTFGYTVRGSAGIYDVTRRALYDTSEVEFFAERGLQLDSNRLEKAGQEEIEGRTYVRWTSTGALDPADEVQVVVTADAGGASGVLVAGAVAAALAVLAILFLAARRGRKGAAAPRGRVELVEEIAALDLLHEAGEIEEAEWSARRGDLKRELEQLTGARR